MHAAWPGLTLRGASHADAARHAHDKGSVNPHLLAHAQLRGLRAKAGRVVGVDLGGSLQPPESSPMPASRPQAARPLRSTCADHSTRAAPRPPTNHSAPSAPSACPACFGSAPSRGKPPPSPRERTGMSGAARWSSQSSAARAPGPPAGRAVGRGRRDSLAAWQGGGRGRGAARWFGSHSARPAWISAQPRSARQAPQPAHLPCPLPTLSTRQSSGGSPLASTALPNAVGW